MPGQIGQLINLKNLKLIGTLLITLPEQIGQLTNLQILDLRYSRLINTLPEQIGHLTSLQTLDLRGTSLPDEEKRKVERLLPNCHIVF